MVDIHQKYEQIQELFTTLINEMEVTTNAALNHNNNGCSNTEEAKSQSGS
jgi:hypothetical protein